MLQKGELRRLWPLLVFFVLYSLGFFLWVKTFFYSLPFLLGLLAAAAVQPVIAFLEKRCKCSHAAASAWGAAPALLAAAALTGLGAFFGAAVGEVIFPEGVTEIGERAFHSSISLEKITLPESLRHIRDSAFADCAALREVRLPERLEKLEIGHCAFSGCRSLQQLQLPQGLAAIQAGAFRHCESLERLLFPKELREIGGGAFSWCQSLSRWELHPENPWFRVEGPLLLTADGRTVVSCLPGAAGEIAVPQGVAIIGRGAFQGCGRITALRLPEGLREIAPAAFEYCSSLARIHLPAPLSEIGSLAFAFCESLAALELPDTVAEIGGGAFRGCPLQSLTIPAGVGAIGYEVFSGCRELKHLTFLGAQTQIDPQMMGYEYRGSQNPLTIHAPSPSAVQTYAMQKTLKKQGVRFESL